MHDVPCQFTTTLSTPITSIVTMIEPSTAAALASSWPTAAAQSRASAVVSLSTFSGATTARATDEQGVLAASQVRLPGHTVVSLPKDRLDIVAS